MRVTITKDYWDGRRSKSATLDLDGMPTSQLSFMLMEAGVAGITITQVTTLGKMIKELEKEREHKPAATD